MLVVVDGTTGFTDDEQKIARLVQSSEVPFVLVANKADGTAAEEAGQMVDEAKDGTQKSGKVVQDAITAMQRAT